MEDSDDEQERARLQQIFEQDQVPTNEITPGLFPSHPLNVF